MTIDDSNIAGKLTDRMLERLVAKIWLAVQAQSPEIRDAYENRIQVGGALSFHERDDGQAVLVTIDMHGTELPLCDATYAELGGELLH